MKTYYIYHIAGIKIGCTSDLQRRMRKQGFTDWEILEEHTDGWLAGDREIELQKEYGLPVDSVHYMISVENRVPSREVSVRGGTTQGNINASNGHFDRIKTANSLSNGGKVAGRMHRHLTFDDAQCIRVKYKQLEGLAKAKRQVIMDEYNCSSSVVQGIIYNNTYLEA